MKYCINCGSKLKENDKFCIKCGSPTQKEIEKQNEIKREKKEEKTGKTILNLGIFLVLFASILFAFISWENMSSIFKVLFVVFEDILFLGISLISKKLNNNKTFNACYFISTILVPVILLMLNYYEIVNPYFTVGAGLYAYLALSSIVCFVAYFASLKYTKSNIYMFLSFISVILFVIFIIKRFYFNNSIVISIVLILTLICNFLINKKIILQKYNKEFNYFLNIIFVVLYPLLCLYEITNDSMNFMNTVITILYVINLYSKCFLNKDSKLKYFVSFMSLSLMIICFMLSFDKNLYLYFIIISSILVYLLSSYFENDSIKMTSLIFLFFSEIIVIFVSATLYKVLLIVNILLVIFDAVIIKVEKDKSILQIMNMILPINIYFTLYALFRFVFNLNICEILLITSIVTFILYLVFKKNNKSLSTSFQIYYILFIIFSTFRIGDFPIFRIAILLNTALWLYYYIMNLIYEKNNLKYLFLVGTIISLIISLNYLHFNFYYILLGIILLLFISHELLKKKTNVYLFIGSALLIATAFFNFDKYSIYSIIANILLYVYSYNNIRRVKKIDIYRILHVFIGFYFIYKILNYLLDPIMIIGILLFIIYLIILIVMYLSDMEKSRNILIYSISLCLPYSMIVGNIEVLQSINYELFMLPFIIYTIVLSEFIKWKNETGKNTFLLVLLILFTLGTISNSVPVIIFDIILSCFYIFYGLFRKIDVITYLGIIYLIIVIVIRLFSIFNSIVIIWLLLVLGVALIIYTFIHELKKKEK